jgi:hypothetical protein
VPPCAFNLAPAHPTEEVFIVRLRYGQNDPSQITRRSKHYKMNANLIPIPDQTETMIAKPGLSEAKAGERCTGSPPLPAFAALKPSYIQPDMEAV